MVETSATVKGAGAAPAMFSDHADDRTLSALNQMGEEAAFFYSINDVLYLLLRRCCRHVDDHWKSPLAFFTLSGNKKAANPVGIRGQFGNHFRAI